jgi:hypothetical protein
VSEHLRLHVGTVTDPKWLPIARELGCAPGVVSNTWVALLEHAKSRRPTGQAEGFAVAAYAEFSGFDAALVRSILVAFESHGLVANGQLVAWQRRQSIKADRTNAERQKRLRERRKPGKVTPVTGDESRPVTGVTSTVTPVTQSNAGGDYRGGSSVGTSASSPQLSTPINHPSTHAGALRGSDVFQVLESEGITAGYLARRWHASTIAQWCSAGVTAEQLAEAVTRARAARTRRQSPQPLNVGFIDRHVADVLAGRPARGSTSPTRSRMEDCDAAVADYLARRGA